MGDIIVCGEGFEIASCEQMADIESRTGYKKLELTSAQRIQMGGLMQQLPAAFATGTLGNAYILKLPDGISGIPMQYKTGGIGTTLQGTDGKIVGHASLQDLSPQAMVFGVFNIMSIASGQHFLAEINSELKSINQKMDDILTFLYEDKEAELTAEISFAKYAYQNYISIMEHEQQRMATIFSLQKARKVAMKNVEFYARGLNKNANSKSNSNIESLIGEAVRNKDCLILSMQLYSMSSLLEMHYSQNYDSFYVGHLEENVINYIAKYEWQIRTNFSTLKGFISAYKDTMLKKVDKPALVGQIEAVINQFGEGKETDMQKSLRTALHAAGRKAEYYVDREGKLYLKTA